MKGTVNDEVLSMNPFEKESSLVLLSSSSSLVFSYPNALWLKSQNRFLVCAFGAVFWTNTLLTHWTPTKLPKEVFCIEVASTLGWFRKSPTNYCISLFYCQIFKPDFNSTIAFSLFCVLTERIKRHFSFLFSVIISLQFLVLFKQEKEW